MNRIKFKGYSYIIERSGKPVAQMEPVKAAKKSTALKGLKSLLAQLPPLDEELDAFAKDLENLRTDQPSLPENDIWE